MVTIVAAYATLNERIAEPVDELNERTMRVYGASRRELFERLDRPALLPLAEKRLAWVKEPVMVNIDYHVEFEHHYYSVPSTLLREIAEASFIVTRLHGLPRQFVNQPRSARPSRSLCHAATPAMLSAATHAILEVLDKAETACILAGFLVIRRGLQPVLQALIDASGLAFATLFMGSPRSRRTSPPLLGCTWAH